MTGELPEGLKPQNKNRAEISKTKIILIDELDFLMNRDQSILYNLFEWPQRKKANLVVLSIANRLDLTETFMERIRSRIGHARLVFSPYSSNDIWTILSNRLEKTQIFDENSLNFLCKKMATISADIRKTLAICRNAIDRYRDSQIQQKKELSGEGQIEKIPLSLVVGEFDAFYNASSLSKEVPKLPTMYRKILVILFNAIKQSGQAALKTVFFTDVVARFRNDTKNSHGHYTIREILPVFEILEQKGYIKLKNRGKLGSGQLRVHLEPDLDDLGFSLHTDEYFKNYA